MIPQKLQEIVEDFEMMEGREKVEALVDYSQRLQGVPSIPGADPPEMEFVEECMTPVYVKSEITDGGMHFYFNVPQESPTVRGLAAILGDGLDGATPEQVLSVPNDFYLPMELHRVLTMQRMNGFAAILAHMKRLAAEALAAH
jgi:cysteine desulfuration protein SufE